jgi:uncharacterized membrane protein
MYMLIYEILSALDIIGLGMLLGGAVYESMVMAPNYRTNVPELLDHVRHFMKAATPASYFRVASPATIALLVITAIVCWGSVPARWWFAGAAIIQIVADTITYSYHYPRNRVMFIIPLSTDTDMLRRTAQEWARGNAVRILLIALATIGAICGMISLVQGSIE